MKSLEIQSLVEASKGQNVDPTLLPTTTPAATPPAIAPQTSATVVGPNLIKNPGFEDGATSWENYNFSIVTSEVHSGKNAVRFGVIASGFGQHIAVVSGKTYRFEAYAKSGTDNGSAQIFLSMRLPDGTDKTSSLVIFSTDYQRYSVDFMVPAGVTDVFVHSWANQASSYSFVDDLALNEIIPSPTPLTLSDEGDSISVLGTHSTMYAEVTSDLVYTDQAVGGSGMNSVESRKAMMLAKKPTIGKWIVTLFIGANDLSGIDPNVYAQRVFAYTDELRAAGAKVAVGTVLPQNTNVTQKINQNRAVYNQLLRNAAGNRIDAVIDYAADPFLGPDSAAFDKTLYSDGLHPTWGAGGGQEIMFRIYKAAVDSLSR